MTARDSSPLLRLADAIAQGDTVDWHGERSTRPELDRTFENLELIEKILNGYRSIAEGPDSARRGVVSGARSSVSSVPPARPGMRGRRGLFHWGALQAL